ncbi:ribosomal protein L15E [Chryseobacterium sp. PvR013]|uniref:hypothetical protein n=1 Tax=Chryseobacterium sp. PvR013 TaxID=2806595 RepID=UPI001AE381EB|nr:hypothetical protein [Chryseobacterium sp. PvR013]MBP1165046.1 ribosomal protein L15E [Chryseobacterium sp. PvR013]
MDEKVRNVISNSIALDPIMGYCPGLLEQIKKADKIDVQKQKLIKLAGEEKASEIFDKIKNEAYAQVGDNGYYIYYELVKINSELEYGNG